jgi:hypothetical protein
MVDSKKDQGGKDLKKNGSSKTTTAQPAVGTVNSTKSLLERYGRIGAQYVRRTETSAGITLLLEVGIPSGGQIHYLTLTQAELRLTLGQTKFTGDDSNPSSQAGGVELPPKQSQTLNWADEVEREMAGSPEASSSKTKTPAPSKKGKEKATVEVPAAPKEQVPPKAELLPDIPTRCATRLGVDFTWLKSNIDGPSLEKAKAVLGLSQKRYSAFLVSDDNIEFQALKETLQGSFRAFQARSKTEPESRSSSHSKSGGSFAEVAGKTIEPSSKVDPAPAREQAAKATGGGKEKRGNTPPGRKPKA